MIKTGSKEKSSKNVSTFCRKIGCKNYNHSGFKMRQTKSTAEKWIEWLKIGGVDMDLPENRDRKNLRLCFRHFKRENLGMYVQDLIIFCVWDYTIKKLLTTLFWLGKSFKLTLIFLCFSYSGH